MGLARSLTVDQAWADMTEADRFAWFNFHGDRFELERGEFMRALARYAGAIKAMRAHDAAQFNIERFVNDVMNTADAALAPEVREWIDV